MRVLVPRGQRAPIKSSMLVEFHHSKMDSNDAEGIREQNPIAEFSDQIEKMQRQNDQFNGTVGSVDLFANLDKEENDLLRKFVNEMDVTRPVCDILGYTDPLLGDPKNASLDAGLFQVPNTVRQPEMDFNRMTSDYSRGNSEQSPWSGYERGFGTKKNVLGPSRELQLLNNQAEQQRLMILDLQKQLHKFTVIQQQQYRQKLLEKEKREMQMEAQIAQDVAAKEAERIRMQSENVETEIVSTDNLPPLCVLNRPNSLDRLESMQARSRQCHQKRTITRSNDKVVVDTEQTRQSKKLSRTPGQTDRVDRSEGSLRKKKQVRANIRVKRGNVAAEKDPIVRGKSTTYACPECDREFNFKCHLIEHLRIHSGEKPFKCGECGSSFSQKISLTVHKRIHTGAKPFECRICNVAFCQKSNLSHHLLIHTNERPFSCDICKQSFRRKEALSDHMNIHSGNRPHKCNVCQKTFRQRQGLSKHRKVHAAPRKKSSRPIHNF
ncbi:zinc finger protein 568-like isoform X2 [Bradysia coprophila]|uniref:zinc finger protein 568-like isoform X2 n=1 Tax=Bradysia coprophila TaxID=38358 RepID=UPI00187DD85E|nr:zinc finger protein 568-like isoform X2 [Bradysia coprophila]